MNLKSEIENYIPFNEQEEVDKEVILSFINTYKDVLTRDNKIGHFTTSAWLVNKQKTKVLMIFHNIYNSWAWIGGHADGEENLLQVVKREIEEETGIKNIRQLQDGIYGISALTVDPHIKRGKYINSHIHFDVEYIFEADENEKIRIKPDENSGVEWVDIEKVLQITNEQKMKPIYQKMIDKMGINDVKVALEED